MQINAIKDWYEILNWTTTPNFQTCHTHKNFSKEYHNSSEINNLVSNIIQTLEADGSANARLMGKMGAGKTTFLYYLKDIVSSNKSLSNKNFFSIIRASKIDDYSEYEENLREMIIDKSFKPYFNDAGFGEAFDRINEQKISKLNKLAKLKTFYMDNKDSFIKKFIVVLDDMDTLDEYMTQKIGLAFKKILGSGSTSKWVVIREATYNSYSDATKEIFTFFNQPYTLPDVSLFEVIVKRIQLSNGKDAKTPFSKKLCEKILRLKNGSIRDSLATLKTILEYTEPKSNKPEEFIQNWLENSAITALLHLGEVENIHTTKYIVIFNYPLVYDLLNIIKFLHIKADIFSTASKIARYKRRNYDGYDEDIFQIIENQCEAALNIMKETNLLTFEHGIYRLTFKGSIILDSSQEHYNETCRKISLTAKEEIDSEYWKVLAKHVDYKKIAEEKNLSKPR